MFEKLANWKWQTGDGFAPGIFSWFHILWLIICIALCIVFAIIAKKIKDEKKIDLVILIVTSVLTCSEIIKQCMLHIGYYHYFRLDIIPFAFCSIPIYVGFVGSLVKAGKVKDACYKFLAFYGIVGGISVMIYPTSVLETYFVYMALHSMFWHTLLVVISVFLIVSKGYGRSFKDELLPPLTIFLSCVVVAIALNETLYYSVLKKNEDGIANCTVENYPGSYTNYNLGTKSDSKMVSYKDNKFILTTNYNESIKNFVLEFKSEEETDIYYLYFEDDQKHYVDVVDGTLQIVDVPINYWELMWLDDGAVLTINVESTNYFISYNEDETLTLLPYSNYEENSNKEIVFVIATMDRYGDSANYFFISSHYPTPIPVLSIIQKHVPYPVFVLTYIISFFGISSLVWCICHLVRKIPKKKELS